MKRIIAVAVIALASLHTVALGNENVTRIEFIDRIVTELGLEKKAADVVIADLDKDEENYISAAVAVRNGLVSGYGNGNIRPHEAIKKEDALVILCRAFRVEPAAELYLKAATDSGEVAGYAKGAVSSVIHNGIISHEYGTKISPKEYITSADMEEFISDFRKYSGKNLSFMYGYPKQAGQNKAGSIAVEIKTSLPCTVYYKLLPSDTYLSGYMPDRDEIDVFLTSVAMANTVVDAYIMPEDNREYNLYIMAVNADRKSYVLEVIEKVTAHRYSVGDGTAENPYRIYDEEQFKAMKYHPDAFFRLESDIELTSAWEPIAFLSGELDGNYHKITGLVVDDREDGAGLFRELRGGTIKRLYLDATVTGGQGVGAISGRNAGGIITECFVTGRVHASSNNAGAIAGINEGLIENSVAAAYMLEAGGYAGGIAGANRRGEIKGCLSAVYSVSSDMYASGVAGVNVGGRIKDTVCANLYAGDVLTAKNGRVTTNKEGGVCENNYCYDKMLSDSDVSFGSDTHDGIEATWTELTSREFYRDMLGWNTSGLWTEGIDEDFRLPLPKGFKSVDMIKGITMYAPIKISDAEELFQVKNAPDMHYILTSDIVLGDYQWDMIAENGSSEEGFNGTFDGNRHTISGMHIGKKSTGNRYGMFGVISSGTVRNLNLKNLTIDGESLAGGIAAENYGYIENCSVSGKIYALRKDNMLSVGGICGNNYGFIEDSKSTVKIRADGQVLTIGGIVANNEGFINNTQYKGSLSGELSAEYSNAVAGGICGINIKGIIYNSYAAPHIVTKASTNYIGGICGIADGGEIYKTAAGGKAVTDTRRYPDATVYAGGVAGLAPKGLIMNSFSDMDIAAESNAMYIGGVAGYNMSSSIQNNYSTSMLDISGKNHTNSAPCYAGGICGYSEAGFISDNVALNGKITSNGIAAAVGNAADELAVFANNYSAVETKMVGTETRFSKHGKRISAESTDAEEFFFRPIAEGGNLGWSKGDIWYMAEDYKLPLLAGVGE